MSYREPDYLGESWVLPQCSLNIVVMFVVNLSAEENDNIDEGVGSACVREREPDRGSVLAIYIYVRGEDNMYVLLQ